MSVSANHHSYCTYCHVMLACGGVCAYVPARPPARPPAPQVLARLIVICRWRNKPILNGQSKRPLATDILLGDTDGVPQQCSLGAAPCYLLFMLTAALLMTPSHSEGRPLATMAGARTLYLLRCSTSPTKPQNSWRNVLEQLRQLGTVECAQIHHGSVHSIHSPHPLALHVKIIGYACGCKAIYSHPCCLTRASSRNNLVLVRG